MSEVFSAPTREAIAASALRHAQACGAREPGLFWTAGAESDAPLAIEGEPTPNPSQTALAHTALAQGCEQREATERGTWRIATPLSAARAAFIAEWPRTPDAGPPPSWARFLTLIEHALELVACRVAVQRLEKTARLQTALFSIADLASSDLDMPEMLRRVHAVVDGLMYAKSFYIALYDAARDSVRFIYFVDEQDARTVDPEQEFPADQIGKSLTLAVIRHGRPAMGPSERLREEFGLLGDTSAYGPESADWLGVPMVSGGEVRGALVVQSYDVAGRYNEEDRALLAFVAQHILTAMLRKQAHAELERRVEARTRELKVEVHERHRGERLQAALYRIADVASGEHAMDDMLRSIHSVVAELMYARNFYIALYSPERDTVRFIYFADVNDPAAAEPDVEIPAEKMANSLTLGLIRHGTSVMGSGRSVAERLLAPGGLGLGTVAEHWLGVPMVSEGELRGAVVVQSYDPTKHYSEEDRTLLTYVAQHILTALARKQAQAELERRVVDRTRELADAVRELRGQIEECERAERQLVHETLHDSLTQLPNRAFLYDALERALARFQRDAQHRFAVLFLDLDRFKVINDSVGHMIGDQMLKEAGRRLAACVRAPDIVARLGGDEFALLLDECHGPESACHVAQRVIDALSEPMRVAGKELFSSASVGIAFCHERYTSAEELLRDADVAMYRAKAHGRHRFEIFDETLHLQARHLLDLEGDLRRAIQRSEFEPHFQPIVRLQDGHVVGYEALLRWHHPQRGLLLPMDFVAVAEESGSLEQIDWQLFEKTCREIPRLGRDVDYVTINVSPRHFRSPTLASQVLNLLAAHRVPAHRVRIEITEGALLDNPDQVLATLAELHAAGVLVALDDFGTGYSSLSYLHRFPLHTLKIDRSFVSALQRGSNGGSAAVVRAVLALASTLGMEVVAEGIESREQCDFLMEIGCQHGQGFLFARPRPAAAWAVNA